MYNVSIVTDFANWLSEELIKRGWTPSELARRSGISHVTYSNILSGGNKPGLKAYRGIAKAFSIPLEDVLKVAGLTDYYLDGENDSIVKELSEVSKYLPEAKKREVLDFARFLYQGYVLGMTKENAKAQIEEILKEMPEEERKRYVNSLLGLISRPQENIQKDQQKSLGENN